MPDNITVNTPRVSTQLSFRSHPHGRDRRVVTTISTVAWLLNAFLVEKFVDETAPNRARFQIDDLFFEVVVLWVLVRLCSRVADISLRKNKNK